MTMGTAYDKFIEYFDFNSTVRVIFGGGRGDCAKLTARPVRIKDRPVWQTERISDGKAFHKNLTESELKATVEKEIESFRQVNIINPTAEVQILISKKGKATVRTTGTDKRVRSESHDNSRSYIFAEGEDIAPLRDLGVFTADNRVVKAKYDKFRQINRFIETIADEFKSYDKDKIKILDFGCGKSYLTFLVYYYFKFVRHIAPEVTGYDLKSDVVESCNRIAEKYGYDGLRFVCADIKNGDKDCFDVDMVITLHACDTATDYALYNAVTNRVEHIFSVPCCQHEVNAQIAASDEMSLLLRHGLIKERFFALVTDAVRCEVLSACGYSVDVLEFIDMSHTPKNLMIRAHRTGKTHSLDTARALSSRFGFKQTLLELMDDKKG